MADKDLSTIDWFEMESDFFKQTIEASKEAIFWLKDSGQFAYVNKSACDSLNYSREELLSKYLWDIDPDYSEETFQSLWGKLAINETVQHETRHQRKDGTTFPVEVYSTVLSYKGKIYHTSFVRNLSERKAVEATLRESENRFRALLDTIPDYIWLKDGDGVYLSCNANFEKLYGAKDIIGKTDYDFVDKDLADFFRQNDKIAMQASKPMTNEEWLTVAVTGEKILMLTTKVPMYAPDGSIIGVLGVGRDITALKKAEEEKSELENQLYQTRKIESIGQLAGGIAHDFNNMLGVILGHCELVRLKGQGDNPFDFHIQEIQKAARHSADLTKQLLTFARKQTISPQSIDLNETVPSMLKMLQRLIGEEIKLFWSPAPQLWPIYVDPSQVDQILANLCVNARDAINGSGNIYIETENISFQEVPDKFKAFDVMPGHYVKIAVTDNGCGMTKEILAHIFEPFYTTKSVGSGTGLGLATVYGAVKQNDGFIDVHSEPGAGTTFDIFFPRNTAVKVSVPNNEGSHFFHGNETILLVEDEEMLLNMESAILAQCGYQVLAAGNAERAVAIAQTHSGPIHILVTDVVMPEMNGWELSKKLEAIRPEMKVLFLSGYSADILSNKRNVSQGINILKKPISMTSLTLKIRNILNDLENP